MEQTPNTENLASIFKFLGIDPTFTIAPEDLDEDYNADGDSDGFNAFLALPDEDFKPLSEIFLAEFRVALTDSSVRYLLTTSLQNQGMSISTLRDEVKKTMELINEVENFSDLKKDFLRSMLVMVFNLIETSNAEGNEIVNLFVERMSEDVQIPVYAREGDSGMDVYALDDFTIDPGKSMLIPTGLKVGIPNGYELQVRPKSGLSAKSSLRIANSPGTIDSLYRDEIKVIVENNAPPIMDMEYHFDDKGKIIIDSILHGSPIYISKGQKFAQLVLMKVPKAMFTEVSSILNIEGNRGGGFGSTGA